MIGRRQRLRGIPFALVLLSCLLAAGTAVPQHTRAASARFFVRQGTDLGQAPDGSDWIQTIQAAIDAAPSDPANPAIIEVWANGNICDRDTTTSACIFFGALTISKPLKLVLKPGTGAAVIEPFFGSGRRAITIDGRAVSMTPENTEISGFIIRNGNATLDATVPGYQITGGGILMVNASPLIQNNVIYSNIASETVGVDGFGGGVYSAGGAPVLRNNVISDNIAAGSDGRRGQGGGVAIVGGSARLERNLIQYNYAATAGEGIGGGVYLNSGDANGFVLDGNTIRFNFASTGLARPSQAGGLFCYLSRLTMTNSFVVQNNDEESGDGLLLDACSGELSNNTIAANGGPSGVGVHARFVVPGAEAAHVTMVNTIVAGHDIGVVADNGATLQLRTTIFNGQASDDATGQVTNLGPRLVDPLFVNQAGADYHIRSGSPAIDAGEQAPVTADVDGQPRFGPPDIGADEHALSSRLPLVARP
jgi:hypothetical protein